MKRIIAVAVLALSAVVTVNTQAQTSQPGAPAGGGFLMRLMEARLNLTSTQRTEIKEILTTEAPTILAIQTQLAAEHKELVALTTFNESETVAVINKYAKSNTAALVEREKVRDEIFAVLTPAQQEQVEELRAKASEAFAQFFGNLGEGQ